MFGLLALVPVQVRVLLLEHFLLPKFHLVQDQLQPPCVDRPVLIHVPICPDHLT